MKKNNPQVETPNTTTQPSQEAPRKVSTKIKCGIRRGQMYSL